MMKVIYSKLCSTFRILSRWTHSNRKEHVNKSVREIKTNFQICFSKGLFQTLCVIRCVSCILSMISKAVFSSESRWPYSAPHMESLNLEYRSFKN